MTYHIDSDHADTIRERFGDPQQQGFSERFMRPQPCACNVCLTADQMRDDAPATAAALRGEFCERNENETTKGITI
jgi:hypothetical protein